METKILKNSSLLRVQWHRAALTLLSRSGSPSPRKMVQLSCHIKEPRSLKARDLSKPHAPADLEAQGPARDGAKCCIRNNTACKDESHL